MTSSHNLESCTPGPISDLPSPTRGGRRMRESCTYGVVRGALSNERPYRDRHHLGRGTSAPNSEKLCYAACYNGVRNLSGLCTRMRRSPGLSSIVRDGANDVLVRRPRTK